MMNGAFGGMVGNPFMSLFWIVLIGAGIYFLARLATGRRDGDTRPPTTPDPEQLLKQRYARGEITREEYEATLRDLRK